ncbi:9569_t:CDS:2 [Racocetra fulgida]|uniref:9569_t:CDS:1 n=1 Tax=Racocetra fulgida TaxID=60492 RepID=A0A9N9AF83_9GLOM|nr:9569_t:CDS:2 [Racocetra fulgida]
MSREHVLFHCANIKLLDEPHVEVAKNTKATKEPPKGKWRQWKVSIYATDDTGEKCPLTFVEKEFLNPGPSFRKLLFQEIPLDSPASQKTTPSRQKKSKSSKSVSKWQKTDSPVTSYESPQSSRSSCSIGESTNDKENFQVDYNKLAKNLYDLEGDDILEVIHLVKEHRTGDMYINEDIEGRHLKDVNSPNL